MFFFPNFLLVSMTTFLLIAFRPQGTRISSSRTLRSSKVRTKESPSKRLANESTGFRLQFEIKHKIMATFHFLCLFFFSDLILLAAYWIISRCDQCDCTKAEEEGKKRESSHKFSFGRCWRTRTCS